MNELETRLRDAMHRAVPEEFDTLGLMSGARQRLVRTRRLRLAAGAAVATVAIVVGSLSASGLVGKRRAEPAEPSPPTLGTISPCPDLQKVITPLTGVREGLFSEQADAVLVCALTGEGSVWPGSLPPDEAVDRPGTLDRLIWRLKDDPEARLCGDRPHGPAFTVSVRDLQGRVVTHPSTDLLCDGWVFLDSYYVGLSEQSADWVAGQPGLDNYPTCPSVLHDPEGQPVELPKGTRLATASACAYPVVDPFAVTSGSVPRMLYPRRGPLGERELALVNANLSRTGTRVGQDPGCTAKAHLALSYVLRAVTTSGQQVWLTSSPTCLPHFHVNGQRRITIVLDPSVVEVITGPLDRFP